MGVVDEIKFKITGQVDGDMVDNVRKIKAELEVVCAKWDLDLSEFYEKEDLK